MFASFSQDFVISSLGIRKPWWWIVSREQLLLDGSALVIWIWIIVDWENNNSLVVAFALKLGVLGSSNLVSMLVVPAVQLARPNWQSSIPLRFAFSSCCTKPNLDFWCKWCRSPKYVVQIANLHQQQLQPKSSKNDPLLRANLRFAWKAQVVVE